MGSLVVVASVTFVLVAVASGVCCVSGSVSYTLPDLSFFFFACLLLSHPCGFLAVSPSLALSETLLLCCVLLCFVLSLTVRLLLLLFFSCQCLALLCALFLVLSLVWSLSQVVSTAHTLWSLALSLLLCVSVPPSLALPHFVALSLSLASFLLCVTPSALLALVSSLCLSCCLAH